MNIITNVEHSLEWGTGSKMDNILLVCPFCFNGRYANQNTYGVICKCGEYFNKEQSVDESKLESLSSADRKIVSEAYLKFRTQMEKNAYEWRDAQMKKGNWKVTSHEPGGKPRNW